MTERPIIFSAPMVLALIDDRKTQTRRLASSPLAKAKPGDRLYVRENWGLNDYRYGGSNPIPKSRPADLEDFQLVYFATERDAEILGEMPRRHSIHMPRWMSRLTLVVTEVRFRRLKSITPADCVAEGIQPCGEGAVTDCERDAFRHLWESLHGLGSWNDNPELVALTFTVHACNIDQMKDAARCANALLR